MLKNILAVAALVVVTAGPSQAQGINQAINDDARIDLMNAQTKALHAYTECLQTANVARPCQPPQPVQTPSPQNEPPRTGFMAAAFNDAQNNLLKAKADALNAYGVCIKTESSGACGPPP